MRCSVCARPDTSVLIAVFSLTESPLRGVPLLIECLHGLHRPVFLNPEHNIFASLLTGSTITTLLAPRHTGVNTTHVRYYRPSRRAWCISSIIMLRSCRMYISLCCTSDTSPIPHPGRIDRLLLLRAADAVIVIYVSLFFSLKSQKSS